MNRSKTTKEKAMILSAASSLEVSQNFGTLNLVVYFFTFGVGRGKKPTSWFRSFNLFVYQLAFMLCFSLLHKCFTIETDSTLAV